MYNSNIGNIFNASTEGIKKIFQSTGGVFTRATTFVTRVSEAITRNYRPIPSMNSEQANIPAQTSYKDKPTSYDYSPAEPSDVYTGLRNDVSAGYDAIGAADNTQIRVNQEKLADFSKQFGQSADVLGTAFGSWLTKYRSIKSERALVGAAADSSSSAENTMGNLISRFLDYTKAMVAILPSLTSKIAETDTSFISLDGDFNIISGLFGGLKSLFGHKDESVDPEESSGTKTTDASLQTLKDSQSKVHVESNVSKTITTNNKKYAVSGTDENHKPSDGTLSPKEREALIYLAHHEAKITNNPADYAAIVSSVLNSWEKNASGWTLGKFLGDQCSQWSAGDDFYYATSSFNNGTYSLDTITSLKDYKAMKGDGSYQIISDMVDLVLSGTRNVNSTQWRGNGKYNTFRVPV